MMLKRKKRLSEAKMANLLLWTIKQAFAFEYSHVTDDEWNDTMRRALHIDAALVEMPEMVPEELLEQYIISRVTMQAFENKWLEKLRAKMPKHLGN